VVRSSGAPLLIAALAALAAGVLALRLLRDPAQGPTASLRPNMSLGSRDEGASELEPANAETLRVGERSPDPLAHAAAEPAQASAEPAPRDGLTRAVWGYVREVDGGAGIAECSVRLGSAVPVTTGADGHFTLQLDAQDERRELRVARVESNAGELLFQGTVRVQPGMEILVQPSVVLRGRITSPSGTPLRATGVSVSLIPDRLRAVEWFLARTDDVSEDGRFEIRARSPSEVPRALELRLGFDVTSLRARADWAALRSPEGATIVVEVCPVRIALVEPNGSTPVAAEELRVAAWVASESDPSANAYLGPQPATELELLLPSSATAIEVAASAPGFAPCVAQRESTPCGQTWTLALARLGPGDVLAGIVVDAEGRPVAGAFASCNLATRDPEVGVAAHAGMRTDAEGRFSLSFPAGRMAQVRAYERDHGLTPEQLVAGGRRDLVLRFPGAQKLAVDARFPPSAGVSASGHLVEWVLALQDGTLLSGSETYPPFEIEEVPPGEHRLFLVALGGAWFASGDVSVYPALDARVELDLQPARHVRGRVLNADGTPAGSLEVRLLDPTWPAQLADEWGSESTGAEGTFELLAGLATECDLTLSRHGIELLRTRVATEIQLEIRLP
jgi:hypothetical protein